MAKACGDNGCGGTCGQCPQGQTCQAGQCYAGCDVKRTLYPLPENTEWYDKVRAVAIEGSHAYLLGEPAALRIIDLEGPAGPTVVAALEGLDGDEIFVSSGYAYTACGSGCADVTIVDISDVTAPEVSAVYAPMLCNDLTVAGEFLYCLQPKFNSKVGIVSISDKSNPELVGSFHSGLKGTAIAVGGEHLYLSSRRWYDDGIQGEGGVVVADVSNPSDPFEVTTYGSDSMPNANDLTISGQILLLARDDGLLSMDISVPGAPIPLDLAGFRSEGVERVGNIAYSRVFGGLSIIDVSDPLFLKQVGWLGSEDGAWWNLATAGGPQEGTVYHFASQSSDSYSIPFVEKVDFSHCLCAECPASGSCWLGTCLDAPAECEDGNAINLDGCSHGYLSEFVTQGAYAGYPQDTPAVVGLDNGGFLTSWLWQESVLGAQVIKADGTESGVPIEFPVDIGGGWQVALPLANGTFAILLRNSFSEVVTYFLNSSGAYQGSTSVLQLEGHLVAASGLEQGGFVTLEFKGWGQQSQVKGRVFDSAGVAAGEAFEVCVAHNPKVWPPSVAGLSEGGGIVAWTSLEFPPDTSATAVAGAVFDGEGVSQGEAFLINQLTKGSQRRPTVAALPNNEFVVAWESVLTPFMGTEVRYRLFGETGTPLGPEMQANQTTAGDQAYAHVAALMSGFLVVWRDDTPAGDSRIHGRLFDPAGEPESPQFVVNTLDEPWLPICSLYPVATRTGNSGFVVAWEGWSLIDYAYTQHRLLYYQRFSPVGQKLF